MYSANDNDETFQHVLFILTRLDRFSENRKKISATLIAYIDMHVHVM